MAKGLTPIIGLAVVVALALAAVFGAMSLTNPAFAAVGAPADAELAERTFSPQAASFGAVTVTTGSRTATFNWDPIEGAASYRVSSREAERGDYSAWTNVTGVAGDDSSHMASGLTDAVTYEYQFEAIGTAGRIDLSDIVTATPNAVPVGDLELETEGVLGGIKLTYSIDNATGGAVSGWEYQMRTSMVAEDETTDAIEAMDQGDWTDWKSIPGGADSSPYTVKVSDYLEAGVSYDFQVRPLAGNTPHAMYKTSTMGAMAMAAPAKPVASEFDPGSTGAGSTTSYTVKFQVKDDDSVNTREDDLVIEFHEDYSVPETIRNASVAITTNTYIADSMKDEVTFTPEDVTVDGNEIFISVGDIDERDDRFEYTFAEGDVISVLFRQSAGISNPTGAGDYEGIVAIAFGDVEYDDSEAGFAVNIPHSISIDPEDGGLGEIVTVKGKGFKNGTSLTVFRDSDDNGRLTSADDVLCEDDSIEGNIGVCTFEVTHPTFTAGATNEIDAVDGVNATAGGKSKTFELKASVSPSPDGGSPGEMILVQVVDFAGTGIHEVRIGGEIYCHDEKKNRLGVVKACEGGVDSQGSGNFSIEIPNWARGGTQELKVWDNASPKRTSASTKITLLGPQIRLTRETVVANQRISLIGTGFSPSSVIANVEDLPDGHIDPMISIGGDPIGEDRINDGDPVRVDNGGNWSASVDLPLSEATTAAGTRIIRVRDSLSRTGTVEVIVLDREVTVTPDSGRVGTIAVIRGVGFPSKNDEGSNFTVEIEYEASNGNSVTVSALTDASGRFETQLRIPTTAAIPSSNQVHVRFEDDDDVTVPITVPHEVPEGIIRPSETSGGPGSTITINGEGFKSFVPISLVKIGTLDITPSPKPSTGGNGMMSFDVTIPGLDVGIQTIEVNAGRTTASVGFTVTESGVNPGDIKEVAPALEDLGDNFVNIWHFNNDLKTWSFYDGEEGSDLTHLITGETYLMQIKSTVEVILNRDTRNLTCVGGNCWNQIVW